MILLAYLLTYAVEIKDKPRERLIFRTNVPLLIRTEQHGLCRALSYIVQTLSAEKAFGMRLLGPVKGQVPAKYNNGGTMADFLIQVILPLPEVPFKLTPIFVIDRVFHGRHNFR